MIKASCIYFILFAISALVLCGCATSSKIEKSETSRKPRITLQVASLDLANLNKRIEQKHIITLAKTLKREQVEVFAVQEISRYPGIAARADLVSELSAQTDWRNVFGETMNISGRQTGNVIFSVYPIISHQNISFEKIIPKSFETVLQVIIDAGVQPLTVISTQLPAKITAEEQAKCVKLITALNPDTDNPMTIVTGNLPSSEIIRKTSIFAAVSLPKPVKRAVPTLWYSTNAAFQLLSSRIVETELGTIVIAQFGLY